MQWWRRRQRDEDLEREIRSHLESEAEDRRDSGAAPDEAWKAARRAFGNTTLVQDEARAVWTWAFWESVKQDFGYALRSMRKSPAFTGVAVLSLALGIGANTAIFTFVNAALLRPLPYRNADRILTLMQQSPNGQTPTPVHPRSFLTWHDQARSFEALAIAQAIPVNTQGPDGAEQVAGLWGTAELFRVFSVQPLMGRLFSDQEGFNRDTLRGGLSGTQSIAILSHGYWQRQYGGDANVLGRIMPLERGSAEIVGVLPADFQIGGLTVDVYLPLPLDRANPSAVGSRSFLCFGLLKTGVTMDAARAEMAVLSDQAARQEPSEAGRAALVLTLRDYLVRDHRTILLVLLGVVVLVLLIACSNLAGLLLTRGVGRRNELALRASLGASRQRLIQQLLIESVAMALAGGALGVLVGSLASQALVVLAKDAVAFGQIADVGMDGRVLAFAFALALATALIFGLAPAWQASRIELQSTLKEHGRGGSDSRGQQRLRGMLVAGEIALAVVLLVGAGLLLQTFSSMLQVKLGFETENVVTMRMLVMGEPARRAGLVETVLNRVEALPDVRSVGTIQFLPLAGFTNNWVFRFAGEPHDPQRDKTAADGSTVSHGYFSAMGIPVLRGRDFTRFDRLESPRVAIVNEAFVRKYSRDRDPVGRQIIGDWANAMPVEIIGVTGDIRHNGLTTEPRPTIFLAQSQTPGYITYLVVRTGSDPQRMAASIKREVRQVDPYQPVTGVQTMSEYVSAALARPRLYTVLLSTFAGLALLLATIGLYGLMSYAVSRRTHEIGIRLALGAHPGAVLRSILRQGARLTVAGLAIGIAAAVFVSRLVQDQLYAVSTTDPLTYVVVALLLAAVASLAAFVPARRASKVDPMVALRYE